MKIVIIIALGITELNAAGMVLPDTEGLQLPAFGSSAEMTLGPTHGLADRINYARPRSRMTIVIIAIGIAELSAAGMVLPDTEGGQIPAFGSSTKMPLGPTHVLGDGIFYARPNSRMQIVIIAIDIAELNAAGTVLDVPIKAAIGNVE